MTYTLNQLSPDDLQASLTKALTHRVNFSASGQPATQDAQGNWRGGFTLTIHDQLSATDAATVQTVLTAHEGYNWAARAAILTQVQTLEDAITTRRLREAHCGTEQQIVTSAVGVTPVTTIGWMKNQDNLIAALRATLLPTP